MVIQQNWIKISNARIKTHYIHCMGITTAIFITRVKRASPCFFYRNEHRLGEIAHLRKAV